jgi:hypothetical protein
MKRKRPDVDGPIDDAGYRAALNELRKGSQPLVIRTPKPKPAGVLESHTPPFPNVRNPDNAS